MINVTNILKKHFGNAMDAAFRQRSIAPPPSANRVRHHRK